MATVKDVQKTAGKKAVERALGALGRLAIEVPSWGFGRGGTRFEAYRAPGDAESTTEKLERAKAFRERTGQGATVALHFPWDGSTPAEYEKLKADLARLGLRAGSINANWFTQRRRPPLDHRLRFGSLTNPHEEVRAGSLDHLRECVAIMRLLGSDTVVMWLPDGTNSPGQISFYDQADRVDEAVRAIQPELREEETLLIEYKIFEPGFYATAIPDYHRSYELTRLAEGRAAVLVDLGHHAPTTNIEQIVALLVRAGALGGFHFNDKKYADDDLASGSLDPAQLFRIFVTILDGERRRMTALERIAFMIDESHNVKDPLEEMVESATNIEIALAKAALVDFAKLRKLQRACDVSAADAHLADAFLTDVRPLVKRARKERVKEVG
jgi:L-rhamnose isomerase/sugar isomerase